MSFNIKNAIREEHANDNYSQQLYITYLLGSGLNFYISFNSTHLIVTITLK